MNSEIKMSFFKSSENIQKKEGVPTDLFQICAGHPDSSVGSVFDLALPAQVRIPLATLAKISIIEKNYSRAPALVCINGLTVTFRVRWFHRVYPSRTPRTALAFPPPLDRRRLRSRIA